MKLELVTVLVLCKNEEANIGRCIGNLTRFSRVVVIDSFSTDETIAIARRYSNVEIFQRDFDSFSAQWNFGLTKIFTPWVFCLDADYIVSPSTIDEITSISESADVSGYYFNFQFSVFGHRLRSTVYPKKTCLFLVSSGVFYQDGHTQRLRLEGKSATMASKIDHDDRKPFHRELHRQLQYAELEAGKTVSKSTSLRSKFASLRKYGVVTPVLMLIYCLINKRLILDGRAGIYYTLQRVLAEVIMGIVEIRKRLISNPSPIS